MANKVGFTGKGLSREPFNEDELAQHREMFREIERTMPTISGLHSMSVGGQTLSKLIGGAIVIGSLIALAVERGLFG